MWGLWVYLVAPLLSLLLWFIGIYLFVERMTTLGGYQAFSEQLVNYGAVVFSMWLGLTLWVLWNVYRYGRNDRRVELPPHVTDIQMAEAMNLTAEAMNDIRTNRQISLHFDGQERPVIEKI